MSSITNPQFPDVTVFKEYLEREVLPNIDEMVSVMGIEKINALMESFVEINLKTGKKLTSTILALRTKIERCVSALYKEQAENEREKRRAREVQELCQKWTELKQPYCPARLSEVLHEALDHVERSPSSLAALPENLQFAITYAQKMRGELSQELDQFIRDHVDIPGIEMYSYLDMAKAKKRILKELIDDYVPGPQQREGIRKIYARDYAAKHAWLKENLANRKIAYCQVNDIHKNMGSGICYQNSCDRHVELVKNPKIATDKLPVGSSPLGRFVRGALIAHRSLGAKEPDALAPYEIDKEEVRVGGVDLVSALLKTRSEPFMLWFRDATGVGHVINVQCDPKNRIFRFCDDNLGYFEYRSQEELEKALLGCLRSFYPRFSKYYAIFSEEF